MLRKPFRLWLMPLLLGPMCALALEIGEIQVNSALNQLFDARIPLPKLTPEELSKVSVKLAPPPMFKEFGLDRASALTNLVFSVEYNAEGEVYVKVVSTQPIREPSLGLLLEFGWPRGKTFREFTVFLDPVQRLAKRSSDRTKTVLDASAAAVPEPAAAPAVAAPAPTPPSAPAVAAPVAAIPTPTPATAAPVAVVATPPAPAAAPVAAIPTPTPAPPPTPTALAPTPAAPAPTPAPSSAVEVAAAASDPARALPAQPPLPVEANKPAPAKTFKGGDSYGPVAAGEGLWKIAIKVRLDPGITPEQMMQALFRANPHAFAKSGIDGLKVGSTLRIPTFREIANFTGSAAAKRLAETEETALSMLAETGPAQAEPSTAGRIEEPRSKDDHPKAFPLAPPVSLEPLAVTATPPAPAPESLDPSPQPAKVESEPRRALPEPAVAVPEPRVGAIGIQPPATTVPEPPKAIAEPAVPPPKPRISEPIARPVAAARNVAPPLLEPVSAAPLPFLAVSEVMTAVVKIPAFAIPAQIVPGSIIADVPAAPSARKIPEIGATPPAIAPQRMMPVQEISEMTAIPPLAMLEQAPQPPETNLQAVGVAPDSDSGKPLSAASPAIDWLAAIEEPVRRVEPAALDLAPFTAGATTPNTLSPAAESSGAIRQDTAPLLSAATDGDRDRPVEAAAPLVVETPPVEAATLPAGAVAGSSAAADSAKPVTEPLYKAGDQYGPVAANERLWDIAAKVRPDPSIGKDVMMRALFRANPQAFSKTGIDRMKVGAMLRIPTLREIADYTGSGVAKQLLEQRAKLDIPSLPKPNASSDSVPASQSNPMSVADPGASSEPSPEGEPKPASESAQPVAETPAPSVAPPAN